MKDIKKSDKIFQKVKKLKDKGVHVLIIDLVGRPGYDITEYYEELVSLPNDVNFMGPDLRQNILPDLTSIICRRVICENEKLGKNEKGTFYSYNCLEIKRETGKNGTFYAFFFRVVGPHNWTAILIPLWFSSKLNKSVVILFF